MGLSSKRSATEIGENSSKRFKLLADDSDDAVEPELELKINESFARRFQYNKERQEKQKLEEKYGKDAFEESESSSEEEDEDEEGDLANLAIDAEISATLNAIRSRDPKIYQPDSNFYSALDITDQNRQIGNKEKPLYLKDYHRRNLLENGAQLLEEEERQHLPYVQEQAALKESFKNLQGTDNQGPDDDDDDDFMQRKTKPETTDKKISIPDPATAEDNPEDFLSKFFESRAWVPTDNTVFRPLESDDEDYESKAQEFEHSWNLRFEDPEISNKTISSHSRQVVEQFTVRREEKSARQRAREREKSRKEEEKKQVVEEKKRLRILKINEMENKLQKIKEASGINGASIKAEDWKDMLEGDFNDDEWNEQMNNRFGEDYYKEKDDVDPNDALSKTHKPKWEDDIDIDDLIPEFKKEQEAAIQAALEDSDEDINKSNTRNTNQQTRRDRRIIEALADQSLPLDIEISNTKKNIAPFRYRDTSPTTFGLTSLDILAAEDSQLNQFAGLKKLATFRDPERKKKDKKKLGKKARLRLWRKETFGTEDGPDLKTLFKADNDDGLENIATGTETVAPKSKRKRKSKKNNVEAIDA